MKTLICILLIIYTLPGVSQTINRNEIDEATNTRVITTNPWEVKPNINEPTIYPFFKYLKTEKGRGLYFLAFKILNVDNIGCLREKTGQVLITFENGENILLKQQSDTNCDYGDYEVSYYLVSKPEAKDPNWLKKMNKHYDMLLQNNVASIAVKGSKDTIQFDLEENRKDIIAKHAKLISNELEEISN